MKLKIGIMGTRGIPNRYGGFEQFAEYLATGLNQKGHEVLVYSSSLHPYKEKRYKDVQLVHCRDASVRLGTAGQFIYDFNCIRDAAQRSFDVLLHLGYTSDSLWWRWWPKGQAHIMNMDGMEWKRSKYNALTRFFLKRAEGWGARHAGWLIADSPVVKNYIEEKYQKPAHYIAYPAQVFEQPEVSLLNSLHLQPHAYSLLIARMEPENNIEIILKGWLQAGLQQTLIVVGDMENRFGNTIRKQYGHPSIAFLGSVYDQSLLNNLRYFSSFYFHGHSVGGTNPSLLEAMACGCSIIAHDNDFNCAVLGSDADYFQTAEDVAALLQKETGATEKKQRAANNREKIRSDYSPAAIIDAYEALLLEAAAENANR